MCSSIEYLDISLNVLIKHHVNDDEIINDLPTGSYEMMADSHCSYEDLTHNGECMCMS